MVVVSRSNGKEYALKRTSRQRAFQMGKKYFMRELDALKDTVQLHIIKLVGSFATPSYVGFIMSPVADCNLESFLINAQHREDMQSWLCTYFGCLANALRYLHYTRKVRHKDIKPSNILVKNYQVIITDLGLAFDWGKTFGAENYDSNRKASDRKILCPRGCCASSSQFQIRHLLTWLCLLRNDDSFKRRFGSNNGQFLQRKWLHC